MKRTNTKIVSIALCTLLFATALPVAEAVNIAEEKIYENMISSSTKYFMAGIILLDWEIIVNTPFIYGFRAIAVLSIEYRDGEPVNYQFLGPRCYIDFDDFSCEGVLGPFFIRAVLTPRGFH